MINKMKLKNWTADKVDDYICVGDCARWLLLWQTRMLCICCSRDVHMPRILPLRVTLCFTIQQIRCDCIYMYLPNDLYIYAALVCWYSRWTFWINMYIYFGRVLVGGRHTKWCYARMCTQPLPPLLCVFLSCIRCVILCFHVSAEVGASVRGADSRLGGHSNSPALPKYAAKIQQYKFYVAPSSCACGTIGMSEGGIGGVYVFFFSLLAKPLQWIMRLSRIRWYHTRRKHLKLC